MPRAIWILWAWGEPAPCIRELKSRGVAFESYDLPDFKTVEHVCVLGAEKAAWFNDPEGNILCLHEDLK